MPRVCIIKYPNNVWKKKKSERKRNDIIHAFTNVLIWKFRFIFLLSLLLFQFWFFFFVWRKTTTTPQTSTRINKIKHRLKETTTTGNKTKLSLLTTLDYWFLLSLLLFQFWLGGSLTSVDDFDSWNVYTLYFSN